MQPARRVRGETLTEVLVAIVVSGLAILMLATVIASATSINESSRKAMNEYYEKSNGIVEASATNGTGTVTLSVDDGSGTVTAIALDDEDVTYYISEQMDGTPIVSYAAS